MVLSLNSVQQQVAQPKRPSEAPIQSGVAIGVIVGSEGVGQPTSRSIEVESRVGPSRQYEVAIGRPVSSQALGS